MIAPIFQCRTKNGKIDLPQYEKLRMQRYISTLQDGAALELIIRKHKQHVTDYQRKYYFGVVVPVLASFFGYDTKEDVHEALKIHFNPIPSKIDPSVMVGGSTTSMSSEEFYGAENSYVKRVVRWAAQEYNINIPDPGEVADL